MKIALIITGQLRTYKLCGNILKNTIIDKYDTDVFLSIDKCNTLQNDDLNYTNNSSDNDIQEVISFFSPKDVFINYDYDVIFENLKVNKTIRENRLILQQYYVVQQGYKLLINYSKTNNINYDVIIRVRFDQFIWSESSKILSKFIIRNSRGSKVIKYTPENISEINIISKNLILDINKPNSNEIYIFGYGNVQSKHNWINDQFWLHSMDLIHTIHNFYNNIPSIIDEILSQGFNSKNCPYFELIFGIFLQNNNINIKKSKIIGEFCREIFV